MKDKYLIGAGLVVIIFAIGVLISFKFKHDANKTINSLEGTVLSYSENKLIIQDKENTIYTFKMEDKNLNVGEHIILEYMGVIDKSKTNQKNQVVSYKVVSQETTTNDNEGIFSVFYKQASSLLSTMSIDQKIKQLLLIRYPDKSIADVGGYVFYERDFKDKTEAEVKNMINNLQKNAKIPLLTAVDEEGGSVVRISSNKNLVEEQFKSPKELYETGGLSLIEEDVKKKSNVLYKLGLNVNLAPVVDVADNKNAYIYSRTIGQNATITANYAVSVINASKGTNVSYVLKHFPGYGNNTDTHIDSATDTRTYDELMDKDIYPFKKGIDAGAEAVLISHNIINSIDEHNPATLSTDVHTILTDTLLFTGVIITDDLDMGATKDIDNKYLKALLAGNDLLIVTDYDEAYQEIKNGVLNNQVSEKLIDQAALKVLAWKYYKYLIIENEK